MWETEIGGYFAINRPAKAADLVFLQSDSNVYAVDAKTGVERWTTNVGSRPNYLSPALWGDSVFVTSNLRSSGGALYALSTSTGTERWTIEGGMVTSPTAENGRVYVSTEESDSCSVRAVATEDGSTEWTALLEEGGRCGVSARPVVYDGRVFATVDSWDAEGETTGTLHVLDTEDGSRRWTYAVDGGIDAAPAVAHDTVYLPASSGGALHAVDLDSRSESWAVKRETARENYWTAPQVADGRVYASNIGGITAFDAADGAVEWDLRRNLISRNGLTVADGTVYTAGKWLAALAADDGAVRWLFRKEEMASTAFSPPVVEGAVAYTGGCLKRTPDENYFHVVTALE